MILNSNINFEDFKKLYFKPSNHGQGDSPPPPPTLPVSETNWDDFRDLGYNTGLWLGKVNVSDETSLNNIPFPIDVFPEKAREYIVKTCRQLRKAHDFLAVACLVVAGTVIGKSRALQLEEGYLVFSNLFACLVGMSGSGKTPALKKAMAPIFEKKLMVGHTRYLTHAHSRAIFQELDNNFKSNKKSDSTLYFKDELAGLFKSINNKNGNEDRENFFSLYDGSPVHMVRPTSEFRGQLDNSNISLLGGLVHSSLPILKDGSGEDGLMGRLNFAILRTPPQGEWAEADPQLAEHWVKIIQCQDCLTVDTGTNTPQPKRIMLDENARVIYRKAICMFETIRNDKAIALGDSHYSILSKAIDQLGRYTLILTLLKHAEECVLNNTHIEPRDIIVDGHTILDALKLLYYFHVNSFHVLHQIDYSYVQSRALNLFNYCKANGVKTISKSMAYNSRFRPISKCTDGDSAEKLFDAIESLGLGTKAQGKKKSTGGRPPTFIKFIFDNSN